MNQPIARLGINKKKRFMRSKNENENYITNGIRKMLYIALKAKEND